MRLDIKDIIGYEGEVQGIPTELGMRLYCRFAAKLRASPIGNLQREWRGYARMVSTTKTFFEAYDYVFFKHSRLRDLGNDYAHPYPVGVGHWADFIQDHCLEEERESASLLVNGFKMFRKLDDREFEALVARRKDAQRRAPFLEESEMVARRQQLTEIYNEERMAYPAAPKLN